MKTLTSTPLDSHARPCGEPIPLTWAEFVTHNGEENGGFTLPEFKTIAAALLRGETVTIGGGAAAGFALKIGA